MNFGRTVPIALGTIKEFVFLAKQQGFAATDHKTTLMTQTSVYSYRAFDDPRFPGMIYGDFYNGNTIEAGYEAVTVDLVLRWRNQYFGGVHERFWDLNQFGEGKVLGKDLLDLGPRFPEAVSAFLKQALMVLPSDFPVRGPNTFDRSSTLFEGAEFSAEWTYRNEWRRVPLFDSVDPFASYEGVETISVNGLEVYSHAYHGGFIRDKYFPLKIV